jgi:hypothetical protein
VILRIFPHQIDSPSHLDDTRTVLQFPARYEWPNAVGVLLLSLAVIVLSGCVFAEFAVETSALRGAVALEGEAAFASRAGAGELGLLGRGAATEAELFARARAAGLTDSPAAIRMAARGLTIGRIKNIGALVEAAAARTVAGFGLASPLLEEVAIIRGSSRVLSYPRSYPIARSAEFKVTSPEGVPLTVLRRFDARLVVRNRTGAIVGESVFDETHGHIRHFTDATHRTLRGMTFKSYETLRHWLIDIDGNPVYVGSETVTIPSGPPPEAITLTAALTETLKPVASPTPTPRSTSSIDAVLDLDRLFRAQEEGLQEWDEMIWYAIESSAVREELFRLSQADIPHYRARLSKRDHYMSKGMAEEIPLTTVKDILIQDRVYQRGILHALVEPEDERDLFFQPSLTEHREVFDRPIHVTPAGGERMIIFDTPLVAVAVHPNVIEVRVLEDGTNRGTARKGAR